MGSMDEIKFGYTPKTVDNNTVENDPMMTLGEVENEINNALDELESVAGHDEAKEKMIEITKKLGKLLKQLRAHDAKNKEQSLN